MEMRGTYFQGNNDHPQHVSVGAILLNEKNEVCCHHLFTKDLKGYWHDQNIDNFYLLMRETPEPNEPLEKALHRGLMEEFGVTAELIDYVGTIQSYFKDKEVEVEKTTLYFLCKLISQDLSKRSGDIESKTKLEWQKPEFLIPVMKEQGIKAGRSDIDESLILERVQKLNYLKR